VSHRLSSATVASKIVVLEQGELVEEGTHRELMEKGGRYFELFSTQASRYLESVELDKNEDACRTDRRGRRYFDDTHAHTYSHDGENGL
jgi:ABC-type multidrug transport system ATPase subunit